jgi:hypothetical protein
MVIVVTCPGGDMPPYHQKKTGQQKPFSGSLAHPSPQALVKPGL